MLTKEQIKSLKKGDKVLAEVEIDEVKYSTVSGIVPVYMDSNERRNGVVLFDSSLIHHMPTPPKYDPCRKFKKGDAVRIVQYKGRDFNTLAQKYNGALVTVSYDEKDDEYMYVWPRNDSEFRIDPAYLELVAPVEERPYSVETNQHGYHIEDRRTRKIVATYNDELHPNAYEAAVAECKRLNEEWRKEHESNIKENRA